MVEKVEEIPVAKKRGQIWYTIYEEQRNGDLKFVSRAWNEVSQRINIRARAIDFPGKTFVLVKEHVILLVESRK